MSLDGKNRREMVENRGLILLQKVSDLPQMSEIKEHTMQGIQNLRSLPGKNIFHTSSPFQILVLEEFLYY